MDSSKIKLSNGEIFASLKEFTFGLLLDSEDGVWKVVRMNKVTNQLEELSRSSYYSIAENAFNFVYSKSR